MGECEPKTMRVFELVGGKDFHVQMDVHCTCSQSAVLSKQIIDFWHWFDKGIFFPFSF